jgi:GGDEF domain-containing protein
MTGNDDPARRPPRRAEKPRHHTPALLGMRIVPSPELMAALRENPGSTLSISSPADAASDSAPGRKVPAASIEQGAVVENCGCPGCGVDFSVTYVRTIPRGDLDPDRDIDVSCPTCFCLVTVTAPQSLSLDDLVVGPPRTTPPPTKVLQRARAVRASDASLGVAHSERIAALELERDDWQVKARTDLVTGVLNERAHTDDAESAGEGHAVFELSTVQAVYDYCGQFSGNQYARDAAGVIALAAGPDVRMYRIGTAKFALIATDLEAAKLAGQRINEALRKAGSSFPRSEGDEDPADPAPTLEEFLARHPKPYGLKVRLQRAQ